MASVDVRTVSGGTAGSVDLPDAVFGIEPNVPVMHQVVTAQLASARAGTQSTKTRAEVRGGGAKPWKQKGTGRARQGSTRAPHWKGGGVALGPKPRSYKQRTPKKMVQLALRSALSDRAAGGNVVVIDSWGLSAPRTKDAKAALAALGVSGRVLVVLAREDEAASKSFRNLPEVHALPADELNAYDVLCSDWVVFTSATIPVAPETPAKAAPAKAAAAKVEMPVYATTAPITLGAPEPAPASEESAAPAEPPDAAPVEPADVAGTAAEVPADVADATTPPADERPAPEGGAAE